MKPIKANLEEVANFYNGAKASFFNDGEYIIYGANGQIGKSRYFNNENAIIMGRVGAYCGSIEIEKSKFWGSDNTIIVKPKNDNILEYLYYLLINTPLRNYAGGVAQPLLTHTILKAVNLKYYKDLKQAMYKLGIDSKSFATHDYRRCYARRVWTKYKDVHVLQELLNHQNPATTMRYLKQSGMQNIDYHKEMQNG